MKTKKLESTSFPPKTLLRILTFKHLSQKRCTGTQTERHLWTHNWTASCKKPLLKQFLSHLMGLKRGFVN